MLRVIDTMNEQYITKCHLRFILILLCYFILSPAFGMKSEQTNPIKFNACHVSDNIHRINANGECLAIQTYFYKNKIPKKVSNLLVFIHGDGVKGGGASDYLKSHAAFFSDSKTISTVLIRPGYYDSYGNYSTGESYAFDCEGLPCDGYRNKTIATIAAGIKELKDFYHPSCIILVGHSGGAMMSGVILGKYPNLVNGAVLASTTNNVHEWSKVHEWGSWPNSLSPHNWISKIPKDTFIYIVSGSKDTNTYSKMARRYYDSLINSKLRAYFILVNNGTHNSIVLNEAKQFRLSIQHALKNCPQD